MLNSITMPEEHFDVMSYYENGTKDQKNKFKLWSKLLDQMYDTNSNRIGMAKMYKVLQAANPEPGAYPTKRYIKDYLSRQRDNDSASTAACLTPLLLSSSPNCCPPAVP